jgi:hypothetical protein
LSLFLVRIFVFDNTLKPVVPISDYSPIAGWVLETNAQNGAVIPAAGVFINQFLQSFRANEWYISR